VGAAAGGIPFLAGTKRRAPHDPGNGRWRRIPPAGDW
jgi:hypothetical protein